MVCFFQHIVTCLCCQPRTFCRAGIPLFWPPATYFTASPALFRHRGHCLSPCWQCHCHTDIGPECGISRHCVTQESACLHAHCHTALWHTFDLVYSTHQLLPLTLAFVLPAKPILTTEFLRYLLAQGKLSFLSKWQFHVKAKPETLILSVPYVLFSQKLHGYSRAEASLILCQNRPYNLTAADRFHSPLFENEIFSTEACKQNWHCSDVRACICNSNDKTQLKQNTNHDKKLHLKNNAYF